MMRPDGKPPTSLPNLAPYGARWVVSLDLHRLPTHVLVAYRDQLDALFHNQVSIVYVDPYLRLFYMFLLESFTWIQFVVI